MMTTDKDIGLVPVGLYCHALTGDMAPCPFWGPGPDPHDGYCHLLGLGDAEEEERAGECVLLWSSLRPEATGLPAAGLPDAPRVGTLALHGKECGLRSGEESGLRELRLPQLGVTRLYDEGVPLRVS